MYDIRFKGKAKKKFKNLLQRLSPKVKTKAKDTPSNDPYPSPTHGETLCKVERKGVLYGIEPTGGDRILYDIISLENDKKIILVHFVGNDDEEIRYLKKYAK
jgi:hypothetical protein